MITGKEKIINDTLNFLKYYTEYYNYPIYLNEIPDTQISGKVLIETSDKKNIKREIAETVSVEIVKKEIKVKGRTDPEVAPLIKEKWQDCESLDSFSEQISDCQKCRILSGTRHQVVFGTGNPHAEIVVVGEAPGADEDQQGKPFVGRAGKLLTDILAAINLTRDEIFICNILKCRPPDNRNPLPDEISNCEPYLFKQLEMIKPKLILAVGTFAAQTLLQTKEPLGKLRGKFHIYKGIKMMVTYHPAALLRNPNWKRPTWEDVQLFRKEYDRQKSK